MNSNHFSSRFRFSYENSSGQQFSRDVVGYTICCKFLSLLVLISAYASDKNYGLGGPLSILLLV